MRDPINETLIQRHLRAGWIGLLLFLILGFGLELMHGLKSPWYLAVENANRRLMWTLAHSHGTLLSLVQLGFVASVKWQPAILRRMPVFISWGLLGGQALLPLGFLLGGVGLREEEPGLGVFLVPVGAAFLLAGVSAVVWNLCRNPSASGEALTTTIDETTAPRTSTSKGSSTDKGQPRRRPD